MLAAPVATCCSHTALHFVENKEHLILVTDAAKCSKPFTSEMIIASLALNWLNNNGRDVDAALGDKLHDLRLGFLFPRNYIFSLLVLREREIDMWIGNARPVELGEEIGLTRIGIR